MYVKLWVCSGTHYCAASAAQRDRKSSTQMSAVRKFITKADDAQTKTKADAFCVKKKIYKLNQQVCTSIAIIITDAHQMQRIEQFTNNPTHMQKCYVDFVTSG